MLQDSVDKDKDTYYDKVKGLQWRVKPEYFVYEDDNAATHLIRNAFGGNRRELFSGIITASSNRAREVRDDTTVQVIFFGDSDSSIK